MGTVNQTERRTVTVLFSLLATAALCLPQLAAAAVSPYLLADQSDSVPVLPSKPVVQPKPAVSLPTVAPPDSFQIPLLIDAANSVAVPAATLQPDDCIDPDTYPNGYYYYYDSTNTPITLTLCNKTYTRT
ncbi:MAG: hypothetical protein V1916_01950, partial [Patescibacteria group bacterium]